MNGSILFNPDINIEVDVDPSAEEGARLVSAKNLVDGQELGIGGGEDERILIDDDGFYATYNQLKALLDDGKRPYFIWDRSGYYIIAYLTNLYYDQGLQNYKAYFTTGINDEGNEDVFMFTFYNSDPDTDMLFAD